MFKNVYFYYHLLKGVWICVIGRVKSSREICSRVQLEDSTWTCSIDGYLLEITWCVFYFTKVAWASLSGANIFNIASIARKISINIGAGNFSAKINSEIREASTSLDPLQVNYFISNPRDHYRSYETFNCSMEVAFVCSRANYYRQ